MCQFPTKLAPSRAYVGVRYALYAVLTLYNWAYPLRTRYYTHGTEQRSPIGRATDTPCTAPWRSCGLCTAP